MEQIKKKRGGKRKNAGRKKGVLTQRSQEILAESARAGISPLEFMLQVLRDETKTFDDRFRAAVLAAPYMHPRLQTTEHKGNKDHPLGFAILTSVPRHDDDQPADDEQRPSHH